MQGAMYFPGVASLMARGFLPFPRVEVRQNRCPTCWEPGVSWTVRQRSDRVGATFAHRDWCPQSR